MHLAVTMTITIYRLYILGGGLHMGLTGNRRAGNKINIEMKNPQLRPKTAFQIKPIVFFGHGCGPQ